MKARKTIALVLALLMAVCLFAGCGDSGSSTPSDKTPATDSGSSGNSSSAGKTETNKDSGSNEFVPAQVPAVPDLGGMTASEWLLSQEDRICLGGVVSAHYDSREDIYKGLDQVDLNDDDVNIAWLSASLGTVFFTTMVDSAKTRCEEYGYNFINYDANFDLTTQIEQLENVLTQDIDFLVVNATDIHALSDYYRQAAELGIPVIVTGPTSADESYQIVTTVLSGSWKTGFVDGEYVAEKLWGQYPDGIKMGALIAKVGDADSESRPCGFIAGYLYKYAELAGTPYASEYEAGVVAYNIWHEWRDKGSAKVDGIFDLCGYVATNDISTAAAQPACAELLTAYPDMDIAFVETDSFGLSMVTECAQMGIEPGKDILIVYASDGSAALCEAVKNGQVLCIGTNVPYPNGEGIIDLIHDIMSGYDANNLPANSYTPTYCVTSENIDEVWSEGQPYAAGSDWQIQTIEEYNAANEGA